MPYLINRNGTFWFQIRVPKSLVPRYGTHIRQNHANVFKVLLWKEFSVNLIKRYICCSTALGVTSRIGQMWRFHRSASLPS